MDYLLEMYDRQQSEHDEHYGDDAPSEFEDGIAEMPAEQTVLVDSRFNREMVKPVQDDRSPVSSVLAHTAELEDE